MTPTKLDIDRGAFIRRICEHPFDDSLRLIFADWLEENEPEDEQYKTLRRQIADSSIEWRSYLQAYSMGYMVGEYSSRRGLMEEVHMTCADFMRHAEMLFKNNPITRVSLTDRKVWKGFYGVYGWLISRSYERQDTLRFELWKKLEPKIETYPKHRVYESESQAFEELSRACVDYGRELARLPKLEWPSQGAG
ncbi:TIGR02996 domain-containing protein [Telmatocola sphagniphila]|uniref:TIGR02996 domain-containing protein n=1 Tax=Telmatocola sphagniphila TaxID=1123043 RepID=A0A8E6B8Q3_9BACT|nr:TIGR02996 domain-containing protein [Telmatocola sphagniphila]QVL33942.1 TIGR02996 domain-containing protein [Telmatocola sphagniphila]